MTDTPPPYVPPSEKRGFTKKRLVIGAVVGFIILTIILGATGALDEPTTTTTAELSSPASVTTSPTTAAPTTAAPTTAAPTTAAPTTAAPERTVAQANALISALQYLEYSSFSRSGLINQLEYEGYSNADATLVVDDISPDWNEQAARSAAQYLEYSAFSRSGLVDQLIYEGYSPEQAEYGVSTTGL